MKDTDEDIDTAEIEEEWIEYMRRSTRLAGKTDEDSQYPLLD